MKIILFLIALIQLTFSTKNYNKYNFPKINLVDQYQSGVKADLPEPEQDINSFSSEEFLQVTNYDLEFTIIFDSQTFSGVAKYTFTSLKEVSSVNFDAWNLNVEHIYFECPEPYEYPKEKTKVTNWEDDLEVSKTQGGTIEVSLLDLLERKGDDDVVATGPIKEGVTFYIYIEYISSPPIEGETPARYDFVPAEETLGGNSPVFYTQNMPIYARALFPCFDTPRIWTTWDVRIKVPKSMGLNVYTNMVKQSEEEDSQYKTTIFHLSKVPTPTYQFAILIGDFIEKQLDDRVYLLCDSQEILDDAATKFSNLNEWITGISDIIGIDYNWDRFEVAIMPKNYPYNGAQHGSLTYVSPTILTSGITGHSVIFHEIANGYFGNMITACNWQNVWLNEGLARFLEREAQNLFDDALYPDIDRIIGNFTLIETFDFIDFDPQLHSTFKSLHPNTFNINPDEAITPVPYEKGYQLMEFISSLVHLHNGLHILRDFIQTYAFHSVDYEIFRDFVTGWINEQYGDDGEAINAQIDWNAWVLEEGFPPKDSIQEFKSTEYTMAANLANKFIQFDGSAKPADYQSLTTWNPDMQYAFLDYFDRRAYMVNHRIIKQLDALYDFKDSEDVNIISRWLTLTSLHRFNSVETQTLLNEFVASTGRVVLLEPIYEALAMSGQRNLAGQLLLANMEFYHPVTVEAIEAAIFRATM